VFIASELLPCPPSELNFRGHLRYLLAVISTLQLSRALICSGVNIYLQLKVEIENVRVKQFTMVVLSNMDLKVLSAKKLEKSKVRTNWAQNIIYGTRVVYEVSSIEQVQELVQSQEKVKTVGTGHTFNFIADSFHSHLSLKLMDKVVNLDPSTRTVVVDAGIRYEQLQLLAN
jgi:hypothetical protein